jgi:inosine-uridine nucleoside N-ribohydrolase
MQQLISKSGSIRAILMRLLSVVFALALISCGGGDGSSTSTAPSQLACVLVDTDYDIDDMMAIPLVIGNKYVAGIITSEGYTYPTMSASALRQQIPQAGQRNIPIIVGSSYSGGGHRDISNWNWIPYYRDAMNRINDLLPQPVTAAPDNPNYVQDVTNATSPCSSVTVLIIGTFSSFVNYSPAIQSKISSVVIMGRPLYPSRYNTDGSLNYSFNCEYDLAACEMAFTQLQTLNPTWVDVPRPPKTEPQYRPSLTMVNALGSMGLPNSLYQALMSNLHTWDYEQMQPENGGPGGNSLMWDQSAALYMVYPEAFSQKFADGGGGAYWTPDKVTPEQLNQLWTNATNKAVNFYQ